MSVLATAPLSTAVRYGVMLLLAGPAAMAQDSSSTVASDPPPPMPFSVGERMVYDVKFGVIHVGSGSMDVAGVESQRGHEVWHTVFRLKGGTIFYHVDDLFESWFDRKTLSSLRFVQRLNEGGKERDRDYVMYPDRSAFVLNNKPEEHSVPDPLDDGSFLYFVRTLPLTVGDTYTLNRYFNPKANPVVIRVLRRERIDVPAGHFNAVVVQPTIKTSGIFSDQGRAEVWFSDDSAHLVLQMKSKLSFGSIDMYLHSYQRGRGAAASVATSPPASPDHPDSGALPAATTPPSASPNGTPASSSQPTAAPPPSRR